MKIAATVFACALLCWSVLAPTQAQAQSRETRIDALSVLDEQFMAQQRGLLEDEARRTLGKGFNGDRERDLALLQDLLDKGIVKGDQTRELQAMGVILGDHLAQDLGMHWVVYEDEIGRSRALRYRETDNYLFPMTMIARRRAVNNTESVTAIYNRARDIIEHAKPVLPYP